MEKPTKKLYEIEGISHCLWEKLSQKLIYFGHQSVGFNIMAGVRNLVKENSQIKLKIIETKNPSDFEGPAFIHSKVGKNHDPKSKINDFAVTIKEQLKNKTDIAFFKFCYVDIEASSDIDTIFSDYKNMMSDLKKDFPSTTFIHVTVPLLISVPINFKIRIKELLGLSIGFFDKGHNIARNNFNKLLRKEYEGKKPLFDLAKFESTHPDGKREIFMKNGKTYYSLIPAYCPNGGHLNEFGRRIIGEQLLIFLANLDMG